MNQAVYIQQALQGYIDRLAAQGPAALDFLNARVPHRYTGVYQLRDGVLRNIHFHDKQGELVPEQLAEVPLQDSFCQFVIRDGALCTSNAATDRCLEGNKYQMIVGSYYGLPVLDNRGELFGTLCHFDFECHPLPDEEFEFLGHAAKALSRYLSTPTPLHSVGCARVKPA